MKKILIALLMGGFGYLVASAADSEEGDYPLLDKVSYARVPLAVGGDMI